MKNKDIDELFPREYCYESWKCADGCDSECRGQCVKHAPDQSRGENDEKSTRGQHIMSDEGSENDGQGNETEKDRPNGCNFVQPPQIPDMSKVPRTDWRIYVDARMSRFESAIEAIVDVVCDKCMYLITFKKDDGNGVIILDTLEKARKLYNKMRDYPSISLIRGFLIEGDDNDETC